MRKRLHACVKWLATAVASFSRVVHHCRKLRDYAASPEIPKSGITFDFAKRDFSTLPFLSLSLGALDLAKVSFITQPPSSKRLLSRRGAADPIEWLISRSSITGGGSKDGSLTTARRDASQTSIRSETELRSASASLFRLVPLPSLFRAVSVIFMLASRNYNVTKKDEIRYRNVLGRDERLQQRLTAADPATRFRYTVDGVRFPLYVLRGYRVTRACKPSPSSFCPTRAYFATVSLALLRETTKAFCSTSMYLPPFAPSLL